MASYKFNIIAGDFQEGKLHRFVKGGWFTKDKLLLSKKWKFFPETVKITDIEVIEPATEEAVKRIGGTVGWGVAGAVILGPVGLLAGLICGGEGTDTTFVCKLSDGRKFMATAPSKTYTLLQAAIL